MTVKRRKTHCKSGHARTPDNILERNGGCRECENIRNAAKNALRKTRPPKRRLDAIREEHTRAGLASFINRRRAKGIPPQGKAA